MTITPEITALVEQLNQELDLTEQEAGEDLATLLGETLETKIRGRNIIRRLEDLP